MTSGQSTGQTSNLTMKGQTYHFLMTRRSVICSRLFCPCCFFCTFTRASELDAIPTWYTMEAHVVGRQPFTCYTDSSRRPLTRIFPKILMPRAGVLRAPHRRLHKKHAPFYGLNLFAKLENSALRRLTCRRVKSLFRRCRSH